MRTEEQRLAYNAQRRERRTKDPEWREAQRVKHAKYYAENKDTLAPKHAEYRAKHREEHIQYLSKWRTANIAKELLYGAERRANKRERPFSLSEADIRELLATAACAYCGRDVACGRSGTRRPMEDSATLDEVNRELGYTKENTVLACWRCNTTKSHATAEELRMIANRMDELMLSRVYAKANVEARHDLALAEMEMDEKRTLEIAK